MLCYVLFLLSRCDLSTGILYEYIPKRFPGHQISCDCWVIDWLIEYVIFLHGLAQQWRPRKNDIWHKGSLGDEDDARTSNTRIAQRKRAIPHTTIKKMTCVVVTALCSPELGLQTSVTTSHVTCVIIHCVWIIDNMEAPLTSCQTVLLSMLTDFHCMETVEDLNVWLVWLRS